MSGWGVVGGGFGDEKNLSSFSLFAGWMVSLLLLLRVSRVWVLHLGFGEKITGLGFSAREHWMERKC